MKKLCKMLGSSISDINRIFKYNCVIFRLKRCNWWWFLAFDNTVFDLLQSTLVSSIIATCILLDKSSQHWFFIQRIWCCNNNLAFLNDWSNTVKSFLGTSGVLGSRLPENFGTIFIKPIPICMLRTSELTC